MGNEAKEISNKTIEEIEKYLLGHMSLEESVSFEKRMDTNPVLKNQVEDFRVLIKAIEIKSLKDQLHHISTDLDKENTKPGLGIKKWLIAASLLVFVGTASIWFLKRPPVHERLFDSYFHKDPGLPTTMGNSQSLVFTEAMTNYKRENYQSAIREWESMLKTDSENDTLNYFIGMAHLADKNAKQSVPFLESVVKNKHSVFLDDTYYYLALAYLKTGKIEQAKNMLIKCHSKDCESILAELTN
ncbi:hypothetical protein [Seonamhaeicola sp.]|uniref:tetratricopeptide repeat protein n=1 Tax=Seonamhaeicola sp. TaxID=1912245 RepID=UPI00261F9255|nr:hypothetical protein [Seonamhaeicola sp.]